MPKNVITRIGLFFGLAVAFLILPVASGSASAQDLTGREILRFSRIAIGGKEYEGLQYVTARAQGFVNMAPVAGAGLGSGPAAAAVEVRLNLVDYQDATARRRLDVSPTNPAMVAMGPSFLVYTGTTGGGMYMGNEFRVSESTATRHWGLMGFSTLNRAADSELPALRQKDEVFNGTGHYVVEVKFSAADTVRYWIDKRDLFISKVVTRYNSKVMVEETRSDYRKVGCMYLPFRIQTSLTGQRLADLTIDSYDLQTVVPAARFTMTIAAN
jgi:hypothetical protein